MDKLDIKSEKLVFEEGELKRNGVVAKFVTTTKHSVIAGKNQTHLVDYYNLDVVIEKMEL